MTVTLITGLSRPAKKNSARLFIAGGAKITRGRGCCTAGGGGGGGGGSGGPDTVYRSQRWRLIPMSLFTAQFTKKEEQKKPSKHVSISSCHGERSYIKRRGAEGPSTRVLTLMRSGSFH